MPSSPGMGSSVWSEPTPRPVNPLGGDTINRRAVCGRTACTVRRGEGPKPIGPSYPYPGDGDRRHQNMRIPRLFRVNLLGGGDPMLQGPTDDFDWPDSWR